MVLRSFERRLERLVEGAFALAFRSGLRPVELGRRLMREMDDHRTVGVDGQGVVPNHFVIRLSAEDDANFHDIRPALLAELETAVREQAREHGDRFLGPVRIEFASDPQRRAGTLVVDAKLRSAQGGHAPGSLVLPDGRRLELGARVVRIGRLGDCQVQLDDPNVSRYHAEIRPAGEGYVVADLGSTNGTKVNGVEVTERPLRDGDEVVVGATRLLFHAS